MRSAILILALVLTGFSAKASFVVDECTSEPLRESITELLATQTPFNEFDLEGVVTISFMVDDEGRIHIKGISSKNIFLADHVIATLQNRIIDCDCIDAGVLYSMRLQYVQYS